MRDDFDPLLAGHTPRPSSVDPLSVRIRIAAEDRQLSSFCRSTVISISSSGVGGSVRAALPPPPGKQNASIDASGRLRRKIRGATQFHPRGDALCRVPFIRAAMITEAESRRFLLDLRGNPEFPPAFGSALWRPFAQPARTAVPLLAVPFAVLRKRYSSPSTVCYELVGMIPVSFRIVKAPIVFALFFMMLVRCCSPYPPGPLSRKEGTGACLVHASYFQGMQNS